MIVERPGLERRVLASLDAGRIPVGTQGRRRDPPAHGIEARGRELRSG